MQLKQPLQRPKNTQRNFGTIINAKSLNGFSVLWCCLFLLSCGGLKQHEKQSTEADVIPAGKTEKILYLKKFNDFQYPPSSSSFSDLVVARNDLDVNVIDMTAFRFLELSLNNGLQVYFLPRHGLPIVSISAIIAAGKHAIDDNDELLSPLVLKLLKQGTLKYPRTEFQKQEALLGEPLKYRQTSQYSVISAEVLPQDLALVLELMSQQLIYLSPDDKAIRKIIEQQLVANKLTQSSGFYLAKLLFYQNNYPQDHFYYYQDPKSFQIKAVTKDQLIDFYLKNYLPGKCKIIIVGDIDVNNLQQQITHYFSNWPAKANTEVISKGNKKFRTKNNTIGSGVKNTLYKDHLKIDLIERKGASQVDILYGIVTVPGIEVVPGLDNMLGVGSLSKVVAGNKVSSDWTGLKILASVIGGGPSSRLFADLREKQGLAYSIFAQQLAGKYQSPFFIQTAVAHEKVSQTISGIKQHLDYLCQHKIDNRELQRIKQQLIGEMAFRLQTNQQWVESKIHQLEITLPEDYFDDMIRQIKLFTSEQLLAIANKYLCGAHNVIIVGEKEKLENDILRELSEYRYQTHSLP